MKSKSEQNYEANPEEIEQKSADWRTKHLSKNIVKYDFIKSFPCLDEDNGCTEQCGLCKHVQNGITNSANEK